MNETEYELRLIERAAASMEYPPTPRLRSRVLAAIAARPAARRRRPALALAAVAAAIAALAAMVAFSIPSSRTAIAEFFGIEGSTIERLPAPAPGTTPTPFPPPSDLPRSARAASIDEISTALRFDPALPQGEGEPEAAYLVTYGDEAVAIVRYAGFDLWQMKPRSGMTFGKGVPQGVVWLELSVAGRPAYFIEGGAHIVTVFDADGFEIPGSERTVARNTLIFSTEYALYRIETRRTRLEAVRIAESLP
jgi:hypothetical protein